MATTIFFEETIEDAAGKSGNVSLEIGRSSFLNGENLVYVNIDGNFLILNEEIGRKLTEAVGRLGSYLNYQ